MCKNLLVGVTGSIHALDIHNYLRLFRESFAQHIKVVMTKSAVSIVDAKTVELFADDRVFIDLWDRSFSVNKAPHIQLTRWADLFVIVPATADIIGKAANGIADDLLSTAILASPAPVVFVPIMNPSMWQNKALQRNIRILQDDGHAIVQQDVINTAVGADIPEEAMGSTPESLLPHLKHIYMKRLRDGYWEEAIREKPMTPIEKKRQQIATAKERMLEVKANKE